MKSIKFLLTTALVSLFIITMNSCKKCKDEDPRARIINNGTQVASVQIQTSGGNTVNINNVDPNTTSAFSSYAAGQVTFTFKLNGTNYAKTVDLGKCFEYDISIDANNIVTSNPIDRNK